MIYNCAEVMKMIVKEDLQQIENVIEKVGRKLITSAKRDRNLIKTIKRRLHSYSQLKKNIENYQQDIEDIKKETYDKDKSIIYFTEHNQNVDKDEAIARLKAEKIREVERKMERDSAEVKEIEKALQQLKDDPDYKIIRLTFFEHRKQEEIAAEMYCDKSTVWRKLGVLLDKLAIILYGADALR